MKIFINGKEFELLENETVYDAAKRVELIDRSVIACSVNGEIAPLTKALCDNDSVQLLTFEHKDGKHVFWHTASHILAQAVKRLYPDTKLTIGPAIENGFYYDFDASVAITNDVLKSIEDMMKKMIDLKVDYITTDKPEEALKLADQ